MHTERGPGAAASTHTAHGPWHAAGRCERGYAAPDKGGSGPSRDRGQALPARCTKVIAPPGKPTRTSGSTTVTAGNIAWAIASNTRRTGGTQLGMVDKQGSALPAPTRASATLKNHGFTGRKSCCCRCPCRSMRCRDPSPSGWSLCDGGAQCTCHVAGSSGPLGTLYSGRQREQPPRWLALYATALPVGTLYNI